MIELAALKAALNIPTGDARFDGLLTEYEAAAVAYVQRRTGWYIGPKIEGAEFVVEGGGGGVLWLPEKASAVTAVKERAYEGGTETAIATGETNGWALRLPPGETHGMRLVRKGGYGWTRGLEYVITATIGYAETVVATGPNTVAAPDDDRADVTALVSHWFENRLPVAVGTVAPPITNHVSARLESRRRRRV